MIQEGGAVAQKRGERSFTIMMKRCQVDNDAVDLEENQPR